MKENEYLILGMMSGTSLDGVDLVLTSFHWDISTKQWFYTIADATTISYPNALKAELENSMNLSPQQLFELDAKLGWYFGEIAKNFVGAKHPLFIASHGHTVFHNPSYGYTVQIGKGSHIAEKSGFNVVCDFRSNDVALGGQGAPLVPIGDKLLFGNYPYCLNLGGIANISFEDGDSRKALDVCFCNMAINYLTATLGLEMDKDGLVAQKGELIPDLLEKLDSIATHHQQLGNSLGKELFIQNIIPLLNIENIEDQLRTVCEHIANQLTKHIKADCLTTGGGAYNSFLIELVQKKSNNRLIIPDKNTIEYKEGLIFALLGLLRWLNQPNSLSSVTGAKKNAIGGAIYMAS